jgi:hypothetical protein
MESKSIESTVKVYKPATVTACAARYADQLNIAARLKPMRLHLNADELWHAVVDKQHAGRHAQQLAEMKMEPQMQKMDLEVQMQVQDLEAWRDRFEDRLDRVKGAMGDGVGVEMMRGEV